MSSTPPDRFFFAHHKCASNWMRKMLRDFCKGRRWGYQVSGGLNNHPLQPAEGKPTFHIRTNARWTHASAIDPSQPAFNLIRDPRDALVSGYWSWRVSHENNDDKLLSTRQQLNELPVEDGLILMLDNIPLLDDLKGWPVGDVPHILDLRYEDLLQDTTAHMARVFKHLEIKPRPGEIDRIVNNCSFEAMTGRKPGQENVNEHLRKGIAGDWKNAFTPKVAKAFHERYQHDLVRLGYETDDAWVSRIEEGQHSHA